MAAGKIESRTQQELPEEIAELRWQLKEANNIISAIQNGGVDALLTSDKTGEQVYILRGADYVYREIVEEMQEGYITLSQDGVILFSNSNFAQMLNNLLDQVIGTSMYELLSPLEGRIFRRFLTSKDLFKREFSLKYANGLSVPVLVSANCSFGKQPFAYMIVTDLTEQKRSEQKFMYQVFDQSSESIVVCDVSGQIIRINKVAAEIFGADILHGLFDQALPLCKEDDGTPFSIKDTTSGDTGGLEVQYANRGGDNLIFLINVGLLTGKEPGESLGFLATLADITQRKRAEEAMKSSNARYHALMEQSFEALALVDSQSQEVVEVNRRFTEMFGYSLPEDAPLYVHQYMVDSKINLDRIYATLRQQRILPTESRICRHKNCDEVPIELAVTVINIDGRDYDLVSMRDMTAERRRQSELARDVELARRLQLGLLPALSESSSVTVRTLYHPANFVSGDSYLLEWHYEGSLLRGFLIDVSGHGLAAALQTASVNVLLREAATARIPLLGQIRRVNARAAKYFADGAFAAIIGFELDLSMRELRYVGAGITQFYANGQKIEVPGMFVGMWEDDVEFTAGVIAVEEGDSFCFLTDGLTDVLGQPENASFWSPGGKDFDADVASLEWIIESGKLRDDATGVCLKVLQLL